MEDTYIKLPQSRVKWCKLFPVITASWLRQESSPQTVRAFMGSFKFLQEGCMQGKGWR